jgi:hypothetical protein
MKINKTHQVQNSLQPKKTDKPYDVVMVYCKYCSQKINIHVYHSLAQLEHYHIVNLPDKISKHLDTRNIQCNHCDRKFVLEKQAKKTTTDYLMKLDCSDMSFGMDSWYEDSIPKYSNEPYSM